MFIKMNTVSNLKNKIFAGGAVTKEEADLLAVAHLEELCDAANEIRERFCGNKFDLCSIVNGKSGKCGEDCKFCAQSAHYLSCVESYPLMSLAELLRAAEKNASAGVLRFSIVTSGKRLSEKEIDCLCESVRAIREKVGIAVCVSVGLVGADGYAKLCSAGASRAHCNLETSERYFPQICTTHTFADKIAALECARKAGLEVCSGGIIGLGESWDDRISLALKLRELGVKSIPVNFLNPIAGTPFASHAPLADDEKRRTVAIFRFILPDAAVRLAGGRGLIADKGESCFKSGANASITGDMLTTAGISAQTDIALLRKLGYKCAL